MTSIFTIPGGRDYSLSGPEAKRAADKGLTAGEWYKTPLPRKQLKALMQRSDWPPVRDTAIWLGLLGGSAIGGIHYWGSWSCVPFFIVYGLMYGSAADSRLHECSHRTAFRSSWLNDAVYHLACFMMMRGPTANRWSHTRHHTYTGIVGIDPEISGRRPPQLISLALDTFSLSAGPQILAGFLRQSVGRISDEEKSYIPESEFNKVIREARTSIAIYLATIAACVATHSILPGMLIGLPRFYGRWLLMVIGLTQHLGLDEDVLDHRLNSRTVYLNPVFRFIYWNMNYHVEHHMFPMVPYHALPALHEAVKHDCPPANTSLWDAWHEILPAVLRQVKDHDYCIVKRIPQGARRQAPAPLPATVSSGSEQYQENS